jgi:1,2-diacylglycerol 3-beta-glucosyltransferase
MMSFISILLLLGALVLGIFVASQLLLFLLSLVALARGRNVAPQRDPTTRFVVIVPAHDEQLLIAQTVDSIMQSDYPTELRSLMVIADNCTDGTAEIARAHGARCFERAHATLRGKPYALDWMIQQLDLSQYDALVIIDADTRIAPDFLRAMERHLRRGERALQGYFGVLNPDQTWLTRLSLLPGTLKFRLHFPGKEVLKLSCPLAGNGMCFDIDIIRRFGWKAYSLTENWEYWVMLTLAGIRVASAPDAKIYSQVAGSLASGGSQRMRWMKGRLQTLKSYGGKLAARGLREPSLVKLDALLEVARPSHAMLFVWSVVYLGVTAALCRYNADYFGFLVAAAAIVGFQLVYFLVGFAIDRPPLRSWVALAMVPWYLAWKILVSMKGLASLRDRAWVRTKRHEL